MANAWIQHVREYREKHGGSYRDALKEAKHTYESKKKKRAKRDLEKKHGAKRHRK